MRRIYSFLIALIISLSVILPSSAAPSPTTATLTIHYQPLVCAFRVYQVAEGTAEQLHLTAAFAGYADSVTGLSRLTELDSEEFRRLSFSLEALVLRDATAPAFVVQTNEMGEAFLPKVNLGLYLILGEQAEKEGYLYTPAPLLVWAPTLDDGVGEDYDVVVEYNKFQKEPLHNEWMDLRVLKIWQDKGREKFRPVEIDVQLWCDGDLYDTVQLNAKNNWHYSWKELSKKHIWTVTEKNVPSDYTVSVEKDPKGVVLYNKSTPPPPPPDELPSTGQLWWPIPILLFAGLGLLVGAYMLHRNESEESQGEKRL